MAFDKKATEIQIARQFLELYNRKYNTSFEVTQGNDHPDVECDDPLSGNHLSLEITLVEDMPGYIEHVLAKKPQRVSQHTGTTAVSYTEDIVPLLRQALTDKLLCIYRPRTALVMKDVTPLLSPSDWAFFRDHHAEDILTGKEHHYGAGIWAICTHPTSFPAENALFCLSEPVPS